MRKESDKTTHYIINDNSGYPSANFLPNKLKEKEDILIISEDNNKSSGYIRKNKH
ncbi:hypothetical protein MWH28_04800 [Natroniella sulfidigena]|uniref:hypothetical protein n=1 Tax=Natroniella sulfidigena TaxID=723921 RepID=UPI00200B6B18|nr:hypothetical protein [Natroniella sulfidigena]MCK8816690.1 hypothetical protein [Natroniella sulfidigena]